MVWTSEQLALLEQTAKHGNPAYMRIRAMAVLQAIKKKPRREIADIFLTTRQTVGEWLKKFRQDGINGLRIKPGRGRKPKTSHDDVPLFVFQSPQNVGLNRSRWTLNLLAEQVPSLKGFCQSGVRKVLIRQGISYKRGQPHVFSPDPLYEEKKRRVEEVVELVRQAPDRLKVFYEDEASFYRQPTQAWLWHWMGRKQPRLTYANKANTVMRMVGCLDPLSGRVHSWDYSKVTADRFARVLKELAELYPDSERIYVILDNWPVHFHDKVDKALKAVKRIELVPLPTYSPWLNYIEKVWKWAKQNLVHAHPYSNDFDEFKSRVRALFETLQTDSKETLKYVGLSR